MTPHQKDLILEIMQLIGEDDEEQIQYILEKCSRDPEALAFFTNKNNFVVGLPKWGNA